MSDAFSAVAPKESRESPLFPRIRSFHRGGVRRFCCPYLSLWCFLMHSGLLSCQLLTLLSRGQRAEQVGSREREEQVAFRGYARASVQDLLGRESPHHGECLWGGGGLSRGGVGRFCSNRWQTLMAINSSVRSGGMEVAACSQRSQKAPVPYSKHHWKHFG